MNQRYNTNNMPHTDILRVCLSCWKRLPTHFSRRILGHQFPNSSPLICNGTCGTRWNSCVSSIQRTYSTSNKTDEKYLENNPFYKKYAEKVKRAKSENPQEFQSKVAELRVKPEPKKDSPIEANSLNHENVQKSEMPANKGPKSWPPKTLDEIMKVELVKDLEPAAIKQLWQEHHISRDCLFSVLNQADYDEMMAKSTLNPLFLSTLPKGDGFEFYLSQFGGNAVYFTPLGIYQLLKENAPPCLTLAHFAELKEEKGLVLMAGEYDDKTLTKTEALNLAKQMALYYGKDACEGYKILRQFNSNPEQFQYMDIIDMYKKNKGYLEELLY